MVGVVVVVVVVEAGSVMMIPSGDEELPKVCCRRTSRFGLPDLANGRTP